MPDGPGCANAGHSKARESAKKSAGQAQARPALMVSTPDTTRRSKSMTARPPEPVMPVPGKIAASKDRSSRRGRKILLRLEREGETRRHARLTRPIADIRPHRGRHRPDNAGAEAGALCGRILV